MAGGGGRGELASRQPESGASRAAGGGAALCFSGKLGKSNLENNYRCRGWLAGWPTGWLVARAADSRSRFSLARSSEQISPSYLAEPPPVGLD